MLRLLTKKLRIGINLKLYDEDGRVVLNTTLHKRTTAERAIQAVSFKKAYIKVTYYPGVHNDGEYETKQDVLDALRIWTGKEQLDFIEGSNWR